MPEKSKDLLAKLEKGTIMGSPHVLEFLDFIGEKRENRAETLNRVLTSFDKNLDFPDLSNLAKTLILENIEKSKGDTPPEKLDKLKYFAINAVDFRYDNDRTMPMYDKISSPVISGLAHLFSEYRNDVEVLFMPVDLSNMGGTNSMYKKEYLKKGETEENAEKLGMKACDELINHSIVTLKKELAQCGQVLCARDGGDEINFFVITKKEDLRTTGIGDSKQTISDYVDTFRRSGLDKVESLLIKMGATLHKHPKKENSFGFGIGISVPIAIKGESQESIINRGEDSIKVTKDIQAARRRGQLTQEEEKRLRNSGATNKEISKEAEKIANLSIKNNAMAASVPDRIDALKINKIVDESFVPKRSPPQWREPVFYSSNPSAINLAEAIRDNCTKFMETETLNQGLRHVAENLANMCICYDHSSGALSGTKHADAAIANTYIYNLLQEEKSVAMNLSMGNIAGINDNLDHETGNKVLRAGQRIINRNIKKLGVKPEEFNLFTTGAGEFQIMMPGTRNGKPIVTEDFYKKFMSGISKDFDIVNNLDIHTLLDIELKKKIVTGEISMPVVKLEDQNTSSSHDKDAKKTKVPVPIIGLDGKKLKVGDIPHSKGYMTGIEFTAATFQKIELKEVKSDTPMNDKARQGGFAFRDLRNDATRISDVNKNLLKEGKKLTLKDLNPYYEFSSGSEKALDGKQDADNLFSVLAGKKLGILEAEGNKNKKELTIADIMAAKKQYRK